jgi:signal transduction histidine kinase
VRLQTQGQIFGALLLESDKDIAFPPKDVSFTELAAKLIAMTIDHRSLKADIQDAKQEKYGYVSLVTHELRVPLTSISGYTDMLVTGMVGELSERQEFFLQTVKRNVGRMTKLIASLSDINRIESGRMNIQLSDFDIAILLEEIAAEFQETLAERDQKLNLEVALELLPVHADKALTTQVLTNLIKNASNYSPEGSTIEVMVGENGACAQARVIDKGIGISETDQSQLFTPFFRSDDENVRQYVGWGLDLAVAQKFVQVQGGDISCQSELGVGSIFTFTLPLTSGEPNSAE